MEKSVSLKIFIVSGQKGEDLHRRKEGSWAWTLNQIKKREKRREKNLREGCNLHDEPSWAQEQR